MRKNNISIIIIVLTVMLLPFTVSPAFAVMDEYGISYEDVADGSEMSAVTDVAIDGLQPIYGKDIKDGKYKIAVRSSSAMFNIEEATLKVENSKMKVSMTMSGQGYLKVFMGTAEEAASQKTLDNYIDFSVQDDGRHVFTVPVEALDKPLFCAAFSKNKHKWYDRSLLFESSALPQSAVSVTLPDYESLEKADRDERIASLKSENEKNAQAEKNSKIIYPILIILIAVITVVIVTIFVRRQRK